MKKPAKKQPRVKEVPADEWGGMPEYPPKMDPTKYQTIHVHFANEADMKDFAKLMGVEITKDTHLIQYDGDGCKVIK